MKRMLTPGVLPEQELVLLGVGHTHAHVVRQWGMQPLANTRLTCISDFPIATYSGMLPGVLAGQYSPDQMQIDLVRLCSFVGARLIVDRVQGLDLAHQQLLFAQRPPVPFDILSIGVGSVPQRDEMVDERQILTIKPMQTFLPRLNERLQHWRANQRPQTPLHLVIVGAGAGGVEIAFCLPTYLGVQLPETDLRVTLITHHDQVGQGLQRNTQRRIRARLASSRIHALTARRVVAVESRAVRLDDGTTVPADLVIWATGAGAPAWLSQLGLAVDAAGFLQTHDTLQSVSHDNVFAVGDSGSLRGCGTPKAGVYAVRQGPVLWQNIQRLQAGQALTPYRPQRRFLKLLNTGDGRAIAEYCGLASYRRVWWKLKNRIDSRFMQMYQTPRYLHRDAQNDPNDVTMRCAGCGNKVAGSILSRVLQRLEIPAHPRVLLGLEQADDAALIQPDTDHPLAVTVDFFAAPLDDPFLVGRIATLNAASDLFAMGATPLAALAIVTLPYGSERKHEDLLFQLLSGSLQELRAMGATLIGGHTTEGTTLTVGFSMLATQTLQPARTEGGLRVGDDLVLTKALGTGVLLAALMRAQCDASWRDPLFAALLTSNQAAARIADAYLLSGGTDVTGFGLAGHLLEMLGASQVSAMLELAAVPLLPGAADCFRQGIASTLAPANQSVEGQLEAAHVLRESPSYHALFDPQTSGGLLLAVEPACTDNLLNALHESGYSAAACIGRVTERSPGGPRLIVR